MKIRDRSVAQPSSGLGNRPVPAMTMATEHAAAAISDRLDRLPATRTIWKLVLLLSLGGCFEFYDLFFTAYIGPGLVRSGLFSNTSVSSLALAGLPVL